MVTAPVSVAWPNLGARIGAFFAVDDPWERPGALTSRDVVVGVGTAVTCVVGSELFRSIGQMESVTQPRWVVWLVLIMLGVLLIGRRRWPWPVAGLAAAHMFIVGTTMAPVMVQSLPQLAYLCAFYSGVAWGRNRRETALAASALVIFMSLWLTWQLALGQGARGIMESMGQDVVARTGPLDPISAFVWLNILLNVLYFGAAIGFGQMSWNAARRQARLVNQARRLDEQAAELERRAVLDERLRIARDLHDVVAHHVSVIGIQAAAARRVLGAGQEQVGAARQALGEIEQSSREAVEQMRGLLGTLRSPEGATDGEVRLTEGGLDALAGLVEENAESGLDVSFDLVERPVGAAQLVPPAIAHSLHRVVQESLANVRRHSTATSAQVVVRVDQHRQVMVDGDDAAGAEVGFAEVEITDNGRPRRHTSGSGLGQLGIRERAATHRGDVEIGPRAVGGYRVRVRVPLGHPHREAPDGHQNGSAMTVERAAR